MCAPCVVYVQKLILKKVNPICFHGVSKCGVLQRWRRFLTNDMYQKAQQRPIIQQPGEYTDVAQLSRLWQHLGHQEKPKSYSHSGLLLIL